MSTAPTDADRTMIADVLRQVDEADTKIKAKPEQIGGYQILDILGRGGMGVVYRARQVKPDREVAVKVLRAALVTTGMLRRFDKEAQVLGRLHHIGIAQIYEAGMDDLGFGPQPYFAMELVDGLPVTDFCDEQKLDVRGRLALIAKICDAVDHAHQKKIIHRDLKPSNILVGKDSQPKVLDFGVARVMEGKQGGGTMGTEAKKLIGTLPYMSPEQVADEPHRIDARSDVYSLGVLSYRILTGRHPFAVSQRSIPQAIRAIQEDEPTRLGLLDRNLRGDVETIVLKTLEKDVSRRYESCADFAADIRRYLNNEPIKARPAGPMYRLRKFARRNRTVVVSAVVVFLALTTGLAITMRASNLAQQRLTDFRRLADVRELEVLKSEAARLYPAIPSNVIPMEDWIERADALRVKMYAYRRKLEELHERAAEKYLYKQGDHRSVRLNDERFENDLRIKRLLDERQSLEHLSERTAAQESRLHHLNIEINRLRRDDVVLSAEIPREHVCKFNDPADLLEHDVLIELVRDLELFFDPITGTIASVKRRLAFAKSVYKTSIGDHREAWNNAIAAIADAELTPQYTGLKISEQLGMVPLGPDPRSGLWEFVHLQTGGIPKRNAEGQLILSEDSGLVFVLLPGRPQINDFPMFSAGETISDTGESTQLTPYEFRFLSHLPLDPFFISKYEMTQGQWRSVMPDNPSRFQSEDPDTEISSMLHPVENVSWEDASLIMWQLGCDLPSEAQWQYVANGTLDCDLDLKSNYEEEAIHDDPALVTHDGATGHRPVNNGVPNEFGCYLLFENVAEWCGDAYERFEHSVDPRTGRRLTGRGTRGYRVIRGADYQFFSGTDPLLLRRGAAVEYRHPTVGIRPARALDQRP